MDQKDITIAIDAMGGDDAPSKCLKGIEIFNSKNKNTKIIILGDQRVIEETIVRKKINLFNFEIINCTDNISNDDTANTILRNKRESSINRGLQIVKDIQQKYVDIQKIKVDPCMYNPPR